MPAYPLVGLNDKEVGCCGGKLTVMLAFTGHY
jgi:hypothetical protein